jgi:hypothetical protein
MAEADAIEVPFQGADLRWAGPATVTLKQFGQRPSGNAQITQWYQWGSSPSRFFVGVGQDDKGVPVVLAKYYLVELPGGGYETLSERASMTFTFTPPGVPPPRK